MEPVSVVVAALLAGASAGLTGTVTDAIKDAYQGLKKLVQKAFADNPAGQLMLDKAEQKPDAYQAALEEEARASNLADNPDIKAAAEQLLAQLKQAGIDTSTYTVTTHDHSRVGAVGPNARVNMGDNTPQPN